MLIHVLELKNGTAGLLNESMLLIILIVLSVGVGLVPLFMGLSRLGSLRKLSSVVLAALNHCEFRISQLEGCHMENLPLIRSLILEENYPKLGDTFQSFEQDSAKLFHNKWTTDVRRYFDREHLLTQGQYRRLSSDSAYPLLAIGLLSSAFFLILCLTLGGEVSRGALPFSILPAITGTLFFFLLYYRTGNARRELDQAMGRLADTTSLRLPVFSDLAGSAVLVDAFLQYDRKMEQSVNTLSSTVSSLLNQEMVQAVSESIRSTLEEALLPTMKQSHELLVQMTHGLSQRQNQGMQELAEHFTNQSAELLARNLERFFHQLDSYLGQLNGTRGELQMALQTLEGYQRQSAALDASIQNHLQALGRETQVSVEKLQQMTTAQDSLAQTSHRLAELQAGSEQNLSGLIANLSQQVTGFAQSMTQLTREIREDSQKNRQTVDQLVQSQKQVLEGYRKLSESLSTSGQNLNRQADVIHRQMNDLNSQLSKNVQDFNKAVTTGMNDVLEEIDTSLSEMTERLSVTTGEIRDAAESMRRKAVSGEEA